MLLLPKVLKVIPKKLFSCDNIRKISCQHVLYKKIDITDPNEDIIDDSDK